MMDEIRSLAERYRAAVAASKVPFEGDFEQAQENEFVASSMRSSFAHLLVGACLYDAETQGRLAGLNMFQAQAALVRGSLYDRRAGVSVAFSPEPETEFYRPEPGSSEVDLILWNQKCINKTADAILSQLEETCDDEVHLAAIGWMVGWLIVGDAAGETYALGSMY